MQLILLHQKQLRFILKTAQKLIELDGISEDLTELTEIHPKGDD